jgi:hypothetical protein
MRKPSGMRSAVGFTVKSGWACGVLVVGSAASPQVVDACRVELSDPDIPDSRQPYHAGFGTARATGGELSRLLAVVRRVGRRSTCDLIDPASIGNDHIRIHALEGQLFKRVVEDAAARCDLRSWIWRERDLYATAAEVLDRPEGVLRAGVTALGAAVSGPWRAEQKLAALAAWLVLSGKPGAKPTAPSRPPRTAFRSSARTSPQ